MTRVLWLIWARLFNECRVRCARFPQWLAWRLPRWLVYWAAIRLIGHATSGPYGDTDPHDLDVVEALHRWTAADNGSWHRSWWPCRDRLTLSVGYYPGWRGFRLAIHENGGRDAGECLDVNAQIGRLHLGLTLWGLGRLSTLTRHLPRGPRGGGYTLGWLPSGEHHHGKG